MRKIFMYSMVLLLFAMSATVFQISSCKKADAQTNCPPPTYPIAGLWIGTYLTDQVPHAPTYCSFVIFPDGTHLRRSKVVGLSEYALFKGSWTITGNVFEYRDTTVSFSGGYLIDKGTLQYKNDGTLTNGTWLDLSGQPYSGTFQNMKRVN